MRRRRQSPRRSLAVLVLVHTLLATTAAAQSTGKLSGRVVDAATGESLPGANVLIVGTQTGTAADVEGNYFLIGVPAGTYDVQASFVGYATQTVSGVEVNAGYTRELDFSLQPGQELAEVVVEYERPMIQKDAIGASRVVSGEDIQNLPVRGVGAVAALQGGVVATDGSDELFVRGGRNEEIAVFVDGVRVTSPVPVNATQQIGVPQQAIQEQEMLIGTIPARFGDAMSGVISITTKSGSVDRFFGSAEVVTSEVLDAYGYNLASFTLGGPIVPNRLTFFVSGEGQRTADANPYARPVLELSDAALAALQQNPQVIAAVDAAGATHYVPLPGELPAGTSRDDLEHLLEEQGLIGGETGLALASAVPQYAAEVMTADDFVRNDRKNLPNRQLDLSGNLTFAPATGMSLRLGGTFARNRSQTYTFTNSLYARDRFYNLENDQWRAHAAWRHHLSGATFYEVQASLSAYQFYQYLDGFSRDVRDALFYGDVDGLDAAGNPTVAHDYYTVARRYYEYDSEQDVFQPRFTDGSVPGAGGVYSLFGLPGTALASTYDKYNQRQLRFSANVVSQLGLHQVEFGGEFEQKTERRYSLSGAPVRQLARFYNDGNVEAGAEAGVDRYEDLPFDVLNAAIFTGLWYGYDYHGLRETDEQDIDAFRAGTNYDVAPYRPLYFAGYVQDKIEYRDLVLNLGLRLDVFDQNTQVLRDPYAVVPIVRAADLSTGAPPNADPGWAVYFEGGRAENAILGFRDTEGHYFNAAGQEIDLSEVRGRPAPSDAPFSTVLRDYEAQVTVMPRIGVSFPVTDQALFFASYNVTAQRPSEFNYLPPTYYTRIRSDVVANPDLRPEKTTQYELGFRHRVGDRAALQLSGFYRTQTNKIALRTLNDAYPQSYTSYYNLDFTTTKGATFEFDLRRTNHLSLNANYTLSFAQGTGSDALALGTIAWRGNYYPDFLAPASFDRRHTFNLVLDYRFGAGEGPEVLGGRILEHFGVNVLATVASGQPYTQFKTPIRLPIWENATDDIRGGINEAYMPWTNRVDLRLDRSFEVGGRARLMAFLWVENLLDAEGVLGVYRGTGLPDDDGFLSTVDGENTIANQLDRESFLFHYQRYVAHPLGPAISQFAGNRTWMQPRRTRLGVRLTF